ncbi:MAG: EamA family transporter [Proteobacteria bacterium]|nr:MAG: EamA family transporter [Pseudomonadota bacterium]
MEKLRNNVNKGIFYMLISSASMTIMNAFIKALSNEIPTIEMVFFRNIIGVFLICLTFLKAPIRQKGGKPYLLLFRGMAGFIAMLAFFYNIYHIPLADAVAYSRTSPIFTAIFAMIFLKESLGKRGWLAIGLGFLGMLLVMQPSSGFTKDHIFGFVNAIFAALAFTSIRELKKYYDTRSIVLVFMGTGTLVPVILMILSQYTYNPSFDFMLGKFQMPQGIAWFYLLGMGVFSSLGQIFMTKAYGETKAGIVGAIGYSIIVFSIVVGVSMGDALPNLLAFMGIFAIIGGGLLNIKGRKN